MKLLLPIEIHVAVRELHSGDAQTHNQSQVYSYRTASFKLLLFKEKPERIIFLDLLSIPHRGKHVKTLRGGVIGCKDKISSCHLNGFPDGNNIGSTVCRGEAQRSGTPKKLHQTKTLYY